MDDQDQPERNFGQKLKQHLKDHKKEYLIGAGCLVVGAGITWIVMRGAAARSISHGLTETAQHGLTELGESNVIQNVVTGKDNTLNSVSYIFANRQGPPSWVIRCLETGKVFTSQNEAAREMGIAIGNISKQLNGVLETAEGFTFERLCMAVA